MISEKLIKQIENIKEKYPDALLLFRCGDSYESYGRDAEDIAKILGTTIAARTTTTGDRQITPIIHHLNYSIYDVTKSGDFNHPSQYSK